MFYDTFDTRRKKSHVKRVDFDPLQKNPVCFTVPRASLAERPVYFMVPSGPLGENPVYFRILSVPEKGTGRALPRRPKPKSDRFAWEW